MLVNRFLKFRFLQTKNTKLRIGILAIHGDVAEHAAVLRALKIEPVEVRTVQDFKNLDGLILPGGESTTIGKLMEIYGLKNELIRFATTPRKNLITENHQLPTIFGTCAGLILLAKFGLLDVKIERNAYGRQLDSFETQLKIPAVSPEEISVAFIRAPKILSVGKSVDVLARFEGVPIFVRQKNIFGASFHPEVFGETKIHEFVFTVKSGQ